MQNILDDMNRCTGCSSCSQSCFRGCISMLPNEEGFLFPHVNKDECIKCGACKKACPVVDKKDLYKDATSFKAGVLPKVYACINNAEDVRLSSSSGGAFSVFAENTLKKGGVVFGAGFSSDYNVYHTYVEDISELDNLRRSKYVQSYISGSFKKVREFLQGGREVIFTGTPCQIGGLKAFLRKDYQELITCEIACHGVPSPKIWTMYINYMKNIYHSEIKAISFRDKKDGWLKSSMKIDFTNGQTYIDNVYREPFFIGFGKSIFNRKCCFECSFKLHNSKADITFADFWGIDKLPETDSLRKHGLDKGVSMVIVNTIKGENALNETSDRMFIQERTYNEAISGNPRLITSSQKPKERVRAKFFQNVKNGADFKILKKKYMNNTGLIYALKKIVKATLIGFKDLKNIKKV